MRRIREVLRYRFECNLSFDRIAASLGLSKGSVYATITRFEASQKKWPLDPPLSDSELESVVYGKEDRANELTAENKIDFGYIRKELNRPSVTLELLWREYQQSHPQGMSRATFFRRCKEGMPKGVDLKMLHKGGDKLFVDYSGDGLEYIERSTGEIVPVELFVGSWGASSFSYSEGRPSQKEDQWCLSHVAAFEYSGCAPHALVPDNLKSAVVKTCRYEPKTNRLYQKLAEHYGCAIIPARVREPKDKAIVESAVGFVQRYILGRLRNRQFFSLEEINLAIRELLDDLNNEPMQQYGGASRRQRFEELDKPHAVPLPAQRFIITDVKYDVGVAPNYHVRYDDHHYSVPHHIARQKVDIYLTGGVVEIYQNGLHLCRHLKQPPNFHYTTIDEHMPPNHRFVRGWSAEWFKSRAALIGKAAEEAADQIMKAHRHPQQGFNSVMGLLNLARNYPPARVEAAAQRAVTFGCVSYSSIKSILEKGLDTNKCDHVPAQVPAVTHENVRGPLYFASQMEINN